MMRKSSGASRRSTLGKKRRSSKVSAIFKCCVRAILDDQLIEREGRSDKEFHFQNWFRKRLESLTLSFDSPGRNSYPDFRLVEFTEGYELKGLAYPGRELNYDCNSQVPCGEHNGRQVYYVFGRYPSEPDGNRYPIMDLVVCHGSFLNADSAYLHKNKSFRGFGSYGDILVRDRKMYVAPTPFALAEGIAHYRTLILRAVDSVDGELVEVGSLIRTEADHVVVAYSFDLRTNELTTKRVRNPNASKRHSFKAYRLKGDPVAPVSLREPKRILAELNKAERLTDDGETS
jgi:hypothetical protein